MNLTIHSKAAVSCKVLFDGASRPDEPYGFASESVVVHWDSLLGAVEVRTPLLVPFTIINTVLELADFWFRHIYGMLLMMKENEASIQPT